jgi:hypothetical protein
LLILAKRNYQTARRPVWMRPHRPFLLALLIVKSAITIGIA